MNKITPQPGIMDIAIYQSGAAHVAGVSNVVKLSSNENPLGPSPRAIEAMQAAAAQMNRYPSSDHSGLRRAIGEVHGLDPEQIICGAGSDEIIAFLCQCYAGPGDEVLYTEHGFSMYRISALAAGATPVEVRERGGHLAEEDAAQNSQDQRDHHDPIEGLKKTLIENGKTEEDLKAIDKAIRARVAEAADFAENSPAPDPKELYTEVLVGEY